MGNIEKPESVNVELEDVVEAAFLACDERTMAALVEYIFRTQEDWPPS